MTKDDVLFAYRLRVLASARELGSVAAACRLHGIHRSTFYRWKAMSDRFGLEILRPKECRRPRMPNAIPVLVEQRIIAFALGAPAAVRRASPLSSRRRSTATSGSRRTASTARCAATASTRGRCATGCSPATHLRRRRRASRSRRRRSRRRRPLRAPAAARPVGRGRSGGTDPASDRGSARGWPTAKPGSCLLRGWRPAVLAGRRGPAPGDERSAARLPATPSRPV